MKKLAVYFTALNFVFLMSCSENKKQPGEEYYDPDYVASTESEASTNQATTETTNPGTQAGQTQPNAGASTDTQTTTPQVTTAQSSGTIVEGAPENKDEVSIDVVKKDKLPASPVSQKFDKGKTLISKSDCLACHKDDAKLVGPAYIDVAKKYEATPKNVDYLVNKIIKGGAGAWGEIPMSPHPNLSTADSREMVNYILSLNK